MNNKNNDQNRRLLDTQRNQANRGFNEAADNALGQFRISGNNSNGLRQNLLDQYENPDSWMGIRPNSSGWFDNPGFGGGGADFGSSKAGYQRFADTGGADDYSEALSGYRNFATGKVGNEDNIRYRATAAVPSFFDAYKRNLQRRQNVQGGYGPGFDAQVSEIGRQAGREGYNASRMAEAEIGDRSRDNAMFGTQGLSQIAQMIQSGKLSGLGGLKDIAATEGSLAESAAGRNQAFQTNMMEMNNRNRLAATAGKEAMYRGDRAEVSDFLSKYLQAISGRSGNELSNLGVRSGIQDRSWMDLIGPLAGVGSSIFTGLGGMNMGKKKPNVPTYSNP